MKTYQSNYTEIEFFPDTNLQIQTWIHTTNFNSELYKQEVSANANNVIENKAKLLISNALNFEYIVVPDLQEWSSNNFFDKIISAGCEKYAIVLGEDIFTKVSVEQTVDEREAGKLIIKYFNNLEDAQNWIL